MFLVIIKKVSFIYACLTILLLWTVLLLDTETQSTHFNYYNECRRRSHISQTFSASKETSHASRAHMLLHGLNTSETEYKRRLPQVIIIGVKKCGTRALLEFLKLHPKIKAPGPEPHFFDRYYHLGLNWYRSMLPETLPDEITMEKTPRYFVSSEVPERVYNMSPNTKLVIVMRDPVIRAISDFTQAVSKSDLNYNVTFRKRVIRRNGEINLHSSLIKTGMYARYLSIWLQYFKMKNIHVISGEDLLHKPVKVLEELQDFIELPREIQSNLIYFNKTRGFYCINMKDRPNPAKCFGETKGRQHVATDADTLQRLYTFYKPYNEFLFKMINKTFHWS